MTRPALTGISVELAGTDVNRTYPRDDPRPLRGRPARLGRPLPPGAAPTTIRLKGKVGGEPQSFEFPAELAGTDAGLGPRLRREALGRPPGRLHHRPDRPQRPQQGADRRAGRAQYPARHPHPLHLVPRRRAGQPPRRRHELLQMRRGPQITLGRPGGLGDDAEGGEADLQSGRSLRPGADRRGQVQGDRRRLGARRRRPRRAWAMPSGLAGPGVGSGRLEMAGRLGGPAAVKPAAAAGMPAPGPGPAPAVEPAPERPPGRGQDVLPEVEPLGGRRGQARAGREGRRPGAVQRRGSSGSPASRGPSRTSTSPSTSRSPS